MKKIKYQGGLTKLITSRIGKSNKRSFARLINENLSALKKKIVNKSIQIDVVSFSSGTDFNEQILSMLSFLRYAGTPSNWTIYSDGSHNEKQIRLLKDNFEFLKIERHAVDMPELCKETLLPYKAPLLDYAEKHPLGKRLFYYLNYDIVRPTIFLDSDILFYDQSSLLNHLLEKEVNGWYLPDTDWGCLDSRYKETDPHQLYPVNGGFILLNRNLTNLTAGMEFLKSLNGQFEYFSEQTVMHILLKENNFKPLDPAIFIINTADQFDFSYLYPKEEMALRHYTGPVRHKMWQKDWKWQLSLS